VFLTTHDMHTARELCDRVAFIVDGALAVIEAPRALMLKHGSRGLCPTEGWSPYFISPFFEDASFDRPNSGVPNTSIKLMYKQVILKERPLAPAENVNGLC
jgi:ABC-type multidrug transport system ATPase subunit